MDSCTLTYYCSCYSGLLHWTSCTLWKRKRWLAHCSCSERWFAQHCLTLIGSRSRMDCFVYCLSTIDEPYQTYIGATMDIDKRLKQHNGILRGGARATSRRPGQWHRICYVKGFTHWKLALSFEWHWKHFSRRLQGAPLDRRQRGLDATLAWAVAKGFPRLEVVYE